MALLKALLPLQFRLLAREWAADSVRTVNAVATIALAVLLWHRLSGRAAHVAASGLAAHGIHAELLLAGGFVAWCALVPLLGPIPDLAPGLGPVRLRTQPVPGRVFLLLALISMAAHPALWIGAGAQGAAALQFWGAASGGLAVLALCLYLLAAVLAGWAVVLLAAAGSLRFFRRRVVAAVPLALMFVLAAAIAAGLRIRREGDGQYVWFHGHSLLLLNAARDAGVVVQVLRRSPPGWLLDAVRGDAPARACAALAFTGAAASLMVWRVYVALATTLEVASRARPRVWGRMPALGAVPGVIPALGAAWARELLVLARSHDIRAGLGVALAGLFLLVVLQDVAPPFAVVWAQLVVLANASSAFNVFGHDARAVDRLRVMPLRSRQIMAAKSLALLTGMAVQLAPFWVACAVRFGFAAAAATVLSSAASALGFALFGPAVSIYCAAARTGRSENTPSDAGGIPGALTALGVGGLAVAGGLLALHTPVRGFVACAAAVACQAAGCRWAWGWLGRRFDARFEALRERLRA